MFRRLSLLFTLTILTYIAIAQRTSIMSTSTKHYLALGDSYTIGEGVASQDQYASQLVAMVTEAGIHCQHRVIAKTGWTTKDLSEAMDAANLATNFDCVTLLIGVNNQYQGKSIEDYKLELTALVKRSVALAMNDPKRVVMISIPDYSITPFAKSLDRKKIHEAIVAFNAVNRSIASQLHVHYVDIFPNSLTAAGDLTMLASDGLHYSRKAYTLWAKQIYPTFRSVLLNK
jgi:lysophospholipase L1-like esterase